MKLNSDVVGWLYCEDTVINYPLVQGPDNNYYLNRMLSKVGNGSGTLFIDYRNARDFSHYNTIIYGHNMKNKTMFGTLPNYRKQEYYDEHPVMYLLTPTQDYKILLFAGYVTPSNSDTYFIAENTEERDLLIEKALSNTTFLSDVEILDTDRIITMSTCVYDFTNARYVVLGVMREVGKYQPPEMIEDVGD